MFFMSTCMFLGTQERKQQRRSVRSRSESERGNDPVPKKKTKKEQVTILPINSVILNLLSIKMTDYYPILHVYPHQTEMAPETTLRTGSQKGR